MSEQITSPRDWDDQKFLGYVEEHSKTERALFHRDDVHRLWKLAGKPDGYTIGRADFLAVHYHVAKDLIEAARARLAAPPPVQFQVAPVETPPPAAPAQTESTPGPVTRLPAAPLLTDLDRGRLRMMAQRAEQEVKARRDAAKCWPAGSLDQCAELAIANRREADAQALRNALGELAQSLPLDCGRGEQGRCGACLECHLRMSRAEHDWLVESRAEVERLRARLARLTGEATRKEVERIIGLSIIWGASEGTTCAEARQERDSIVSAIWTLLREVADGTS